MTLSLRLLAIGLTAVALAGCNLGRVMQPEGVLPSEAMAPPPFVRGGATPAPARAEPADRRPLRVQAEPRRERLDRPGEPAMRRIRREDLEDSEPRRGGGGPSMSPVISPGGGVGLGGRF